MDKKALDFIVHTYAAQQNARVTIFHVYAQIPDMVLSKNTVMEKMSANLNYLRNQIQEQEGRIRDVLQQFLASGFHSDQVDYYKPRKMDIAREIIQLARDKSYKTIVT
jgi:regulator of sirC expression with transglutaminase-like and TPR domain